MSALEWHEARRRDDAMTALIRPIHVGIDKVQTYAMPTRVKIATDETRVAAVLALRDACDAFVEAIEAVNDAAPEPAWVAGIRS